VRQRFLVILALVVAVLAVVTLVRSKPSVAPQIITNEVTTEVTRRAKGKAAKLKSRVQEAVAPLTTPKDFSSPVYTEPIEWGSDPFVRDWMLMSEVANLNLRAITVTSDGGSALINDQIVQAGDLISGKKVVSIEPDRVTLEQGGRTFTLILGE